MLCYMLHTQVHTPTTVHEDSVGEIFGLLEEITATATEYVTIMQDCIATVENFVDKKNVQ